MMKRIIEPDTMDNEENKAYLEVDLSEVHNWFYEKLFEFNFNLGTVLDVGCGSAQAMIKIAGKMCYKSIIGLDCSSDMVRIAKNNIKISKLSNLSVQEDRFPTNKSYLANTVISKVVLHHFNNPLDFWKGIKQSVLPGGLIFVMDLKRPKTKEELNKIISFARLNTHSKPAVKLLKRSLLSAFTKEEIELQLKEVGFNINVEEVNEKYLLIYGHIK